MNYIYGEPKPPLEEVIEHYGIKGMKWGVRRDRATLDRLAGRKRINLSETQKRNLKRGAIIAGTLVLTAGAIYAGHTIRSSGSMPITKLPSSSVKAGATSASATLSEPVDIVWATRGKDKGFRFLKDGKLSNPVGTYESAFGADGANIPSTNLYFEKLTSGAVAASFPDPKGRKDFAGRTIPHNIIIPPPMAKGLSSVEDVQQKIWPQLEKTYDDFYKNSIGR